MMKKRKNPDLQDENSSEMEVDNEEKVELVEGEDDEPIDDDDDEEERNPGEENAFLDTFYGLSSSDPLERAQAANALLHYCLLGPDANIKDAAYAFRRLLNGICSGRAAARQGNASALTSFLKIALEGGQLEEIRSQGEEEKSDDSLLEYVRLRLLKATDPSQTHGKKKGSEERDYQFGRLFGILSVARSGILLPGEKGGSELDDVIHVASGFVSDLAKLYHYKKWMKEPAAHAIGSILNTFYAVADTKNGKKVVTHLVEEVVIPKILLDQSGDFSVKDYCAEQIAIAANIQSHMSCHPKGLPAPLDEPILSPETIPVISNTLAATSSVVQPRTHLVWDTIWLFLTQVDVEKSKKTKGARKLRKELPLGSSSVRDIVESLVQHVVSEGLLKVASTEGKATHERRALALCVVRNLLGVQFHSSVSGPTTLQLEPDDLEQIVLTPVLIKSLFLDVICAGSGKKKAHHLRPLALQILGSLVSSMIEGNTEIDMRRRFVAARCLVRCEPKFDALTKTTTVTDLIGLSDVAAVEVGASYLNVWQKFHEFLEEQLVSSMLSEVEGGGKVLGYIDLLYHAAKRFLRMGSAEEEAKAKEFNDFRTKTVNNILAFFMVSSFFDCEQVSIKIPKKKSKETKKKKGQQQEIDPLVEASARLNRLKKKFSSGKHATLPYNARSVLSERFYSLLNENINGSIHATSGSSNEAANSKDSAMLIILSGICKGWQSLEANGAKPLFPAVGNNKDDSKQEASSPEKIVSQLQSLARDLTGKGDSDDAHFRARKRCARGCAVLASTLFLHLLGCGRPEDIMDEEDVTTEEDDDSADIIDAIEEIGEITPLFVEGSLEDDQNSLAGFAELCVNVLSSGICSANPGRGASAKLIREAVKFAWMGILAASAHVDRALLDSDVVSVLLNGIGAADGMLQDSEHNGVGENESGSDGGGEDDDSSGDDLEGDFSKIGNILGGDDDETDQSMDETDKKAQDADEGDQDVEIDSEKLNSLLEEDSDADVDAGELEHHEGADAALAMLIKMKQEARKASKQARERLEIAKQLRCTLLIETLLTKSDSWSALIRSDIILQFLIPMLSYRNQLEKSLSRTSGKVNSAESSEKRELLDRLTHLLKQKVFKLKLASFPASESVDILDIACNLASELMDMARNSSSKEQRVCCSGGLNMVLKAVPTADGAIRAASVYDEAVDVWATKRTSKLEASIFDDFINHCPSVAQAVLVEPLASATTRARSPFLKCECFRLLALLFNPKLNPQSSDLDKKALSKMKESGSKVVSSICESLKNEDMQKAKRVREVLKTTEKVLLFAKSTSAFSNLDDLSAAMSDLDTRLGNKAVHEVIQKLNSTIDSLQKGCAKGEEDQDMADATEEDDRKDSDKKDKKKKKKKKKRGKK